MMCTNMLPEADIIVRFSLLFRADNKLRYVLSTRIKLQLAIIRVQQDVSDTVFIVYAR